MKAHNFHVREAAMKEPKQCALPLHQANYSKRFREESRLELVRLLAELLIQALKSNSEKQGDRLWIK
jgi:hypothetical protein